MIVSELPWVYMALGAVLWHLIFGLVFVIYAVANGILYKSNWKERFIVFSLVFSWPVYVYVSLNDDRQTWGGWR